MSGKKAKIDYEILNIDEDGEGERIYGITKVSGKRVVLEGYEDLDFAVAESRGKWGVTEISCGLMVNSEPCETKEDALRDAKLNIDSAIRKRIDFRGLVKKKAEFFNAIKRGETPTEEVTEDDFTPDDETEIVAYPFIPPRNETTWRKVSIGS
jgi:hypothetical protein